MLLLESATEVAGLTVYRDHIATTSFHYMPGVPRIVMERDRPKLALIRYRGTRTGARLSLDVDLAISDAVLNAAREALGASIGAQVNLVPVLFREGAVRLSALGVESTPTPLTPSAPSEANADTPPAPANPPRLVERVLGTAVPSLLGKMRASFALDLDNEGAALATSAILGGELPLVIAYELAFDGLRPARCLRANVNYQMAYTYLRERFTSNALILRSDIDREMESLRRAGLIAIEDVDYLGSDDPEAKQRRQTEILATLREMADALFFRPAASPCALGIAVASRNAGIDAAWAATGRVTAAFMLRSLEQHEEQSLVYDLTEASVARSHASPQGALQLPFAADRSELIRDIELAGAPTSETVRVFTLPDADWSGVEAVTVDIRSGAEVRSFTFHAGDPEQIAILPLGVIEHRERVLATLSPEALGSVEAGERPFQPLLMSDLLIDPAVLSGRRILDVALGVIDPKVVSSARIWLSLGANVREILLDPDRPCVSVPVWGNSILHLEAELRMFDSETVRISQAVPPSQSIVLINQPASLFHIVVIEFVDPLDRYASVLVELEGAVGAPRRALVLNAASPSARWSTRRLASETPGKFRFRTRNIGKDARVIEGEWREASGSLLLVGDPGLRVETIDVVLIGAQAMLGAVLRITSLTPPPDVSPVVELFFEAGAYEARARIPFQGARRFLIEGTVFFEAGERIIEPFERSSEVVVVVVAPWLP